MCNRYGIKAPLHSMMEELSDLKLPLRFDGGLPNLQPRDDVRPTNAAPLLRPVDGGVEMVERRWTWSRSSTRVR
jgi:putative SOS response-associated peptidase YedK